MRIAVVNCNTTTAMTDVIAARARATAQPGTEILPITPRWGVTSAEGWFDSFVSAAAVLYELERLPDGTDGVVMAGFGEHGREGARELLNIPVVDITEAAAHFAMLLGRRFGIVTPLARSVSQIEDSLATAGLASRCAAIEPIGLSVLELDADPQRTSDAFATAAMRAIGRGAEVICLGCAGLAGIEEQLRDQMPVPIIDGVAAAARHSSRASFAAGSPPARQGPLPALSPRAGAGNPGSGRNCQLSCHDQAADVQPALRIGRRMRTQALAARDSACQRQAPGRQNRDADAAELSPPTDLASAALGGTVVYASDELFADARNLVSPAPATHDPTAFGPRGKIYDG